jgi:hypothetical protein
LPRTTAKRFSRRFAPHRIEPANGGDGRWRDVPAPWIFGKKRMLPTGVIERIDYEGRQVFVDLTKDQIRDAPDYDAVRYQDEAYRSKLGTYYGRFWP